MARKNVKVIRVDTNTAQSSVQDLRKELKELRNTLLKTEKGTEEYNEAMRQAAEIQHTLKEQMEEVNANAMDFGQIASNVTKATGGMVAGFQAVKATMNLLGIENENVLKAMQKMQSLMALTQAFPSIDAGVKAFKRLRLAILGATTGINGMKKALISTGIGAAVVAVGLLAANWDKVTDALKRWGVWHENTKDKLKEQARLNEDIAESAAKAAGKYDEWVKQQKVSKLNATAKKQYDELSNSIEGYTLAIEKIVAEQKKPENTSRSQWQALQDEGLAYDNLRKEALDAQDAILNNADSYKEITKEVQKHTEAIEIDTEWITKQVDYFKQLRKSIEDARNELSQLNEEEDEDEAFLTYADEIRKRVENTVTSLQNAFITVDERYAQEQADLETALNTKLITEEEYYKLSTALRKEYNDNQKALAVAEAQVWIASLQNIGGVFDSIAGMIDTSTEEGEEKYKALMYTSTVISMLAGIGGAIASAFMPVNAGMTIWGQIAMAATTSASVMASGIAQLVQIKNANKNSSLNGTNLSSPSTSAVNNIIAPVQYTQDVQGASIEGAIKDTKVYVTETDITNTQNRVRVSENESRF